MKTKLLPNKFKLIGMAMIAGGFFVPIILGMMNNQPWEQTQLRRTIAETVVLLGLLFIVLSKEKMEDEFIADCRLRAAASAFAFGIVFYIVTTFMQFRNLEIPNSTYSAFRVLVTEAIFYIIIFHLLLRGIKKANG